MLEWQDGVTTSRNGYAVWVSVPSTRHRARIPGHDREVSGPEHRTSLGAACRAAGGGLPDMFPPVPAHGGIYLDNHPEHPGTYSFLHPMYWILELAGRSKERWPVTVRIGTERPVMTELVRSRTDYNAPHPGLDISLPGHEILDAIASGNPIAVDAQGPQVRLVAEFAASPNVQRAARLMHKSCPPIP